MAMGADKYLSDAVEGQQERLRRALKRLETRVVNLAQTLHQGEGGEVTGWKWTMAQAREFHKSLAAEYEAIYGRAASKNIDEFQNVAEFVQGQFEEMGVPAPFGQVHGRTLKALGEQSYQVYHTLGADSQNRIAQAVYDSLLAGIEPAELNARIAGAINGHVDVRGRPLAQYATLYAQDSTMGVYRSMHVVSAEQAGLDHFVYTGTVIEDTRPFCRRNLGRVLSREEIAKLDQEGWNGKSGPAMTHCGGYNCRHHWQAVDPEWIRDADDEGDPAEERERIRREMEAAAAGS
jgi:hypothetical protein